MGLYPGGGGGGLISGRAYNRNFTVPVRLSLFKIWRAFMVGDARLLILLPLETRQVAPDNTVVLMLKLGDQT